MNGARDAMLDHGNAGSVIVLIAYKQSQNDDDTAAHKGAQIWIFEKVLV